jgi:hypothetical protein
MIRRCLLQSLIFVAAAPAVFITVVAPAFAADDGKQLMPLAASPSIEKSCGKYFATTTFGGKTGAPTYVVYRVAGSDRNEVNAAARVHPVEIDDALPTPKVKDADGGGLIFRMNSDHFHEAAACLPKSSS